MKKLLLIPLSFLILLLACNGKSPSKKAKDVAVSKPGKAAEVNYVQSLRLKSPIRGAEYAEGEAIRVEVKPRSSAGGIDSLQIFTNGKLQQTLYKKPWACFVKPKGGKMGKNKLKAMAYHSNGDVGLVSIFINLRSGKAPEQFHYKVVKTYAHNKEAYTQGLFIKDGYLYEGTGQMGGSFLRKSVLETGEVIANYELEDRYFGEGITWCKGKVLQLTWKSGQAFVYNPDGLSREYSFDLQTSNNEGWGITCSEDEVFVSDGSNIITVLNPDDYSPMRQVEVYDHKGKVDSLNELEYINGKIYANVWLTDRIVMIDPKSGRVTADIDLKGLLTANELRKLDVHDDVLNGIAWDEEKQRLLVTGKHWPKLFEIELVKR